MENAKFSTKSLQILVESILAPSPLRKLVNILFQLQWNSYESMWKVIASPWVCSLGWISVAALANLDLKVKKLCGLCGILVSLSFENVYLNCSSPALHYAI